jgi:hypothetical protein
MPKNIPAADARIVAVKSLEAGSGDVSESMDITTHTNFYNILHFLLLVHISSGFRMGKRDQPLNMYKAAYGNIS